MTVKSHATANQEFVSMITDLTRARKSITDPGQLEMLYRDTTQDVADHILNEMVQAHIDFEVILHAIHPVLSSIAPLFSRDVDEFINDIIDELETCPITDEDIETAEELRRINRLH